MDRTSKYNLDGTYYLKYAYIIHPLFTRKNLKRTKFPADRNINNEMTGRVSQSTNYIYVMYYFKV